MKFWDMITLFHEHVAKDHSTGADGLAAVRFLRDVFEPYWKEEGSGRHPFRHVVARASRDWYMTIIEYATKLRALERVSGFEFVRPRIGDPEEYLGAWAEMEVALMFRLGGFDVAFLEPGSGPRPDLRVRRAGMTFTVEVGSLHPPDEDTRVMNAVNSVITAGFAKVFSGGVVTGGIVSRPPSYAELSDLDREVRAAIGRSLDTHRVVRVSLPGVATVYVAPHDLAGLAGQMPEDCRGQFRTVPHYRGPPEGKIARAIRDKQRQVDGGGLPSVLVLFDRFLERKVLASLFEDPADDVGAVLSTLPSVMGLLILAPLHDKERFPAPSRKVNGDRISMRINTGNSEQALADGDRAHVCDSSP